MVKRERRASPTGPVVHIKRPVGRWKAINLQSRNLTSSWPSLPQGKAAAHAKHSAREADPLSVELGERFHALPPELRAHIFSFVLVRPVKWDLPHRQSCSLRTNGCIDPTPVPSGNDYGCVAGECEYIFGFGRDLWPHELRPGWLHPWRSEWAPEVRNPYMCSSCWDNKFRSHSKPPSKSDICLCARREGLETLLVCKQWCDEAGRVFYSRNTFAFENAAIFWKFMQNLPLRWRSTISRVSILRTGRAEIGNVIRWASIEESRDDMSKMWSMLRSLPSPAYFELDAWYLADPRSAKAMLRLGLRTTRQICFVMPTSVDSAELINGNPWIWPQFHQPKLLTGGFASEVALAMKGQRRMWMKDKGLLLRALANSSSLNLCDYLRESHWSHSRLFTHSGPAPTVSKSTEFDSHDCVEWKELWLSTSGVTHPAFLAEERYVYRSAHWRDWTPRHGSIDEGRLVESSRHGQGRFVQDPDVDHRVAEL